MNPKLNTIETLEILTKGRWVENGHWVNELGKDDGDFESIKLRIEIPRNLYRNLLHVLDSLVKTVL